MKIKITYQDGEALQARTVEEWVRVLWPQVKVHKSDRYAPFLHTYMTVNIPEKPRKASENREKHLTDTPLCGILVL